MKYPCSEKILSNYLPFLQATTATHNGGKGSPDGQASGPEPMDSPQGGSSPPAGVGETTYHEWYQKVSLSTHLIWVKLVSF